LSAYERSVARHPFGSGRTNSGQPPLATRSHPSLSHELDDLCRTRTAVHVIANEDNRVAFVDRWQSREQLRERSEVAVNIADCERAPGHYLNHLSGGGM
jgi:hypothetical protein